MKRYTLILLLALATSLGMCAQTSFSDEGITYEVIEGQSATVKVVAAATSYEGNIHIPETVSKDNTTYTVTTIAAEAFNNCQLLLSITLPESVTTVEAAAISHCENLYTITFGKGLVTLKPGNFTECPNLCHINYWGESGEMLSTMVTLCDGIYPRPTIHCNLDPGSNYNVLPFNRIRMGASETYKEEAYSSFVTYLPLDFTNTGLRAIIATSLPTKDDNTITYRTVNKVPAGTAIFVKGNAEAYAQEITVPVITNPAEIAEAQQLVKDNKLQGSTTDVLTLKPISEEKVYAINKVSNTLRYIDPTAIPYLRSNVTYFAVSQTDGASPSELRFVKEALGSENDNGTSSAITTVQTEQAVTARDLMGRPTRTHATGITILGGKKTMR